MPNGFELNRPAFHIACFSRIPHQVYCLPNRASREVGSSEWLASLMSNIRRMEARFVSKA